MGGVSAPAANSLTRFFFFNYVSGDILLICNSVFAHSLTRSFYFYFFIFEIKFLVIFY